MQPYAGPATIEPDKGKVWLDVPVGCSYILDAVDVRRYQEAIGRDFDPNVLAVLQFGDGPDLFVSRSTDPVEEGDWRDAPGPAWKQRLLQKIKEEAAPPPKAGEASRTAPVTVLGWATEPTYVAGSTRRMRLSVLLKNPDGEKGVLTGGVVGTATREVSIHAVTKVEGEAAVAQQVDTLLARVYLEPPVTRTTLKWVAGPKRVPLSPSTMQVYVPAGFVCLTGREELAAYCKVEGLASTSHCWRRSPRRI